MKLNENDKKNLESALKIYNSAKQIELRKPDFNNKNKVKQLEIAFDCLFKIPRQKFVDDLALEIAEEMLDAVREQREIEKKHRVFLDKPAGRKGWYMEDWDKYKMWDYDRDIDKNYRRAAQVFKRAGLDRKFVEVMRECAEHHCEAENLKQAIEIYKELNMCEKARECLQKLAEWKELDKNYVESIKFYHLLGMDEKIKDVWKKLGDAFLAGNVGIQQNYSDYVDKQCERYKLEKH